MHSYAGYSGKPLVRSKSGENLPGTMKTCSSRVTVNRLSSQPEVVLSSQVAATERFVSSGSDDLI